MHFAYALVQALALLAFYWDESLQPELRNCKLALTRRIEIHTYTDQDPYSCRQLEMLHAKLIGHISFQDGPVANAGALRSQRTCRLPGTMCTCHGHTKVCVLTAATG